MINKYAHIENNLVTNIIICEDSEILSLPGKYIKETNETNKAEIGYEYVFEKNKFKAFQPYPSWILNENTMLWESPIEIPSDAEISSFGTVMGYSWNEEDQVWIKIF